MKSTLISLVNHKEFYLFSLSIGTAVSYLIEIISVYNSTLIFGTSISLWIIAFLVNIVDIHTGIKADTVRRELSNESFRFESRKGWRAFEKIFIFTMIIWFIYTLETEAIRLDFPNFIFLVLQSTKFVLLIYVILVELQSIGENEEVRFGEKSRVFRMLDEVIEVVNKGVIKKLRELLRV